MSNPARARLRDRVARALGAVQPRQPAQLVVAKRLHAEAQAIDAGRAKARQPGLGDRLGIGFERHLGVGGHVEAPARTRR